MESDTPLGVLFRYSVKSFGRLGLKYQEMVRFLYC